MPYRANTRRALALTLLAAVLGATAPVRAAEVIVHGAGSSVPDAVPHYSGAPGAGSVEPVAAEPLTSAELEALVGPVALYPDELLAIVLPAATYPLQIVQAARYLEALEGNSELSPDPAWDESVVALLNYPDVLHKLDDDLDWTWELGQAVIHQEGDVIAAVTRFREDAHDAGHLRSDERQRVAVEDGVIEIHPEDPSVLYVPDYEPATVVRSTRVTGYRSGYRYYPRPYPVYYYPYDPGHHFASGYFWGLTSAFTIGWHSHNVYVYHYGHRLHPYYGRSYAYRHHRYWQPYGRPYYHGYSHLRPRYGDFRRDRHRHERRRAWNRENRRDEWRAGEDRRHDRPGNRHRDDRGERRHAEPQVGSRPRQEDRRASDRPTDRPIVTPRSGRGQIEVRDAAPGRHTATVRSNATTTRPIQAPRSWRPRAAEAPRPARAARAPRSPAATAQHRAAPRPPAAAPATPAAARAAAPAPNAGAARFRGSESRAGNGQRRFESR